MTSLEQREITNNLNNLIEQGLLNERRIYLFGHCNTTEHVADLIIDRGYTITGILDNNKQKYGLKYHNVKVMSPSVMSEEDSNQSIVLIAVRFYSAMKRQLREIGYDGEVLKLIEYESFSEYSLDENTIARRVERAERGRNHLLKMRDGEEDYLTVYCPFTSLGDVFYAMAYLPHYLRKQEYNGCKVLVLSTACANIVGMFGFENICIIPRVDMEEMISASLYYNMPNFIVAHNDKPYFVYLSKAVNVKKISFDKLYCSGVYNLPVDTKPCEPTFIKKYSGQQVIVKGKTVILSPYANSVPRIDDSIWRKIVDKYNGMGYLCYTNVIGTEKELPGTKAISPKVDEMQDVVERAGHFIGIRSGLCDVIRFANCHKVSLYPDYFFKTTKWKAIDIFEIDGWDNIPVQSIEDYDIVNWN